MANFSRIAYTLLVLFLYSCHSSDKAPAIDATINIGDQGTFIANNDSGQVLADWSKSNSVIFHCTSLPDDMHPCNGNSSGRAFINNYTQAKLVASDIMHLSIRPDLVKSLAVVSADELSFTYELREEPRWDDGTQLTVDDVVFTFKANTCPLTNNPAAKSYLVNLKTIVKDAQNPRKFTLVMKERYLQNTIFLTEIPIMQQAHFDPKNVLSHYSFEEFGSADFKAESQPDLVDWAAKFNAPENGHDPERLVGLGAYQISSWTNGQGLVLTKKKKHWSYSISEKTPYQQAYPDEIIFKLNQDEQAQILEFKNQSLDASTWVSTKTLLELQKDANFNRNYYSHFTDSYDYTYLGFNLKPDGKKHAKLFTETKVRKALALLTPIDQFINLAFHGKAGRMASIIVPAKKAEYNTELKLVEFNPELAKKMLDEAGWKDSDGDKIRDKVVDGKKTALRFELNYMAGPSFVKDFVQLISESFYAAGVKVEARPLEFGLFYEKAQSHDFDAMLGAWSGSCFPDDFTQTWHSSSWSSNGSNYTGFGNQASDDLIDSIKICLNDSIRIPLVKRLQRIIYEEQPYIFLYSAQRKNIIHKRFANANMFYERPGVMLNNLKLRK